MDDVATDPARMLIVIRQGEPTRLERQLLATAYERVLPLQRCPLDHARASGAGLSRTATDSRKPQPAAVGA
jgi:hypothetical protein